LSNHPDENESLLAGSLPDGTTGWLNSNSGVRYYHHFVSDRKVTLNGEAFFDVFSDKRGPFRVILMTLFLMRPVQDLTKIRLSELKTKKHAYEVIMS
jgi:hypothetical protein